MILCKILINYNSRIIFCLLFKNILILISIISVWKVLCTKYINILITSTHYILFSLLITYYLNDKTIKSLKSIKYENSTCLPMCSQAD